MNTKERNYKKLQNGSDIRGIALTGIVGELPNLTPDEAERLAMGFLLWLSEMSGKSPKDLTISIGYDPRLSGKHLQHGIINGLGPYGVHVLRCGLASTPAMFMSTVFPSYSCDGAIMITASHLPFNRNGFKFFSKEGGLSKNDISAIIQYAESDEKLALLGTPSSVENFEMILGKKTYKSTSVDLMGDYCHFLREKIIAEVGSGYRPLDGLKIVVDAGNGGGGFYATDVLAPLGADISNSQFLEPDGTFPNHAPNPEDKEAMQSISMKVLATGADFGLIFDTDVDRSAAVDSCGREIARNGIVAMAAALIADAHPGSTVVTDSITSQELTSFLEKNLCLVHHRFKRGYKNVIDESIKLNRQGVDSPLAIETSGHAAFKENFFLDDGAYLATKIVIKAALLTKEGKSLDSVIASLAEPFEAKEIRLPIQDENFGAYGDTILQGLEAFVLNLPGAKVASPNYEGIRISFDAVNGNGWCLLRKSLHDPIMPLNIESNAPGGCKLISETLKSFLSKYSLLDLTPFEKI